MKRKAQEGRSLFDVLDEIVEREDHPTPCTDHRWQKTLTIWPGENFERLTWTCDRRGCGEVRGRVA